MQHKINNEIFAEALKCIRSGYLACTKPDFMKPEIIIQNRILRAEMSSHIACSLNDRPGKKEIGKLVFANLDNIEALCDFLIESEGKIQLFCCFPVDYELTNYEIHQAAFVYNVMRLASYNVTQVVGVRFKNKRDNTKEISEDNMLYRDITVTVKGAKRQNMVIDLLNKLNYHFRNNSSPKIQPDNCCVKPYRCPMFKYCYEKTFGKEENIFDLNDAKFHLRLRLYWKHGIKFDDIPRDFILPERSVRQKTSSLTKKEIIKENELKVGLIQFFFAFLNAKPRYNEVRQTLSSLNIV